MGEFTKEELEEALRVRHTPKVQARLSAGRVAVAGLGGLGSNIAVCLARIGVGHLHLVDFDRVDLTNLNRQQYFLDQVGMAKTQALRDLLLRINPYLEIIADEVRVTEENAGTLFSDEEIICEAFDAPEAKALLANAVLERFPEKKLICASGMAGWESGNSIRTRRLGRNFYLCGDGVTGPEAGRGLMAPRVALCAAHQANMAVRLLLGEAEP